MNISIEPFLCFGFVSRSPPYRAHFELLYLKCFSILACCLFKRSDFFFLNIHIRNSFCHSVKNHIPEAGRMLRSLNKKNLFTLDVFYSVKKYKCNLWLFFFFLSFFLSSQMESNMTS